jgi:CO/xanthine dehydrogenase FAD-binding subunit
MEVAVVGLAARLSFDAAGTVVDARVAVCSVAPSSFRASEAEQALVGSKLEDDAVAEAGEHLMRSASPIDDARATAAYRRRVLAPLLRSAVLTCRERAVSNDEERQWN